MLLKDHYAALGVPRLASAAEIKKAFRALVLQYHPDRGGESETAKARFREVQEAWDVLGNAERRARYDEERWLSGMDQRGQKTVPNTPAGIRDEMVSVCRSLDGLDSHRIDRGVLGAYLLHLLRPARLAVLEPQDAVVERRDIITTLLPRMHLLSPAAYGSISSILLGLAGEDADLQADVSTHARQYRQALALRKWQPYILLLVALLLCGLMVWYGRRVT